MSQQCKGSHWEFLPASIRSEKEMVRCLCSSMIFHNHEIHPHPAQEVKQCRICSAQASRFAQYTLRTFLVIIEEIIIVRVRGCHPSQKTLDSFTTLGAGLVPSQQDLPTVNPEVRYFLSGGPFCSLCTEVEAGANLKNWPILCSKMARKMVKQESCPSLLSPRRIQGSL